MGRKLTKKQQIYVHERARGASKVMAAERAGASIDADNHVKIEDSLTVKEELARIRAETAANSNITKEQVVQMLLDAVQMARTQGDAQGMIGGARELGKMLGHYAPEIKKTLHGLDEKSIKRTLELLSDEELLRISHGRVIDSTATREKDSLPLLREGEDTE